MADLLNDVPVDTVTNFDLIMKHGHQDLVQAVAFNGYGDRCATGGVDGRIRVFNRHKDGVWRHCDNWKAHDGEVLELQWLPPTISPNLVASLGLEGRFKMWAEDAAAAPGRRFGSGTSRNGTSTPAPPTTPMSCTGPGEGGFHGDAVPKAAYETRSAGSPYRSFGLRHIDETRHTYLALLTADGRMTVLENDQVENLAEWTPIDEFSVFSNASSSAGAVGGTTTHREAQQQPPRRGEECSFRVRFDPNPDVCYTARRAGVPGDALGLAVAAMDGARVYRSRDVITTAGGGLLGGAAAPGREFYLAAELPGHGGLVRDVAWAPGNIRGYDVVATACQDGHVRVFRVETPLPANTSPGTGYWSAANVAAAAAGELEKQRAIRKEEDARRGLGEAATQPRSGIRAGLDQSSSASSVTSRGGGLDRRPTGQPGQIRHVATEVSRLQNTNRTPVWRVGFDDDGQILGSAGDDGNLVCYRQTPDGAWAKDIELSMVKTRMATA